MREARHERPSDRDPQRSPPGPCGGSRPGAPPPQPARGVLGLVRRRPEAHRGKGDPDGPTLPGGDGTGGAAVRNRTSVEVFTSAAFRNGTGGSGIAIRAAGETVRVIRRAVLASSPVEVAYRALLHGLWRGGGPGGRPLPPPPPHPPPAAPPRGGGGVRAAVEALGQDPRLHEDDLDAPEPLPLFSSAGSTT